MSNQRVRVLLIDDATEIFLVMQANLLSTSFEIEQAESLSEGLKRLSQGGIGLVLLDLGLPDSDGFDTFQKVHGQFPRVPVVVLTGFDDERLALRTVQEGAQDYLVKGQVHRNELVRALRYAVERHRLEEQLRNLSLVDELTGLHNRRGFLTLAAQQLKVADRTKRALLLLFADLDQMKWINDTFGHPEGDRALQETAAALKKTFRSSDIVARYGGDEFAVLAIEYAPVSDQVVRIRLQTNLDSLNADQGRRYPLSLSLGTTRYDPNQPLSLEELIAQADRSMYEEKRSRQR